MADINILSDEDDDEMPVVKVYSTNASQGQPSSNQDNNYDPTTTDITIRVGAKCFPAHKSTLAKQSLYFQRMFDGDWKEKKDDVIELQETPACEDVFETFLNYFYNGAVSVNNRTVIPVVILADKYDVVGLKEACASFMVDGLTKKPDLNRVFEWMSFANQMNMPELVRRCCSMICFNFERASSLAQWPSLSFKEVQTILERSDVVVPGEYSVYLAVERWLEGQGKVTEQAVATLVSHIQFKSMTVRELCEVEESTLVADSKCATQNILKPFLYDAFRYVAVKEKHPEGRNEPATFQRYYSTLTNSFKPAQLEGNCTANLEPKCEWTVSTEPSYYTWTFERSRDSDKYQMRLPYSSREFGYGTSYLCESLPGNLRLRVIFFFYHKNGVLLMVMSDTCDTKIPKSSGATLGQFTKFSELAHYSYEAHAVKYSFSIEKIE